MSNCDQPPPSAEPLWHRLPAPQRQRLISILSQMLENHLSASSKTEVSNEPQQ